MGLGQYGSLGQYCDPNTASFVFLILIHTQGKIQVSTVFMVTTNTSGCHMNRDLKPRDRLIIRETNTYIELLAHHRDKIQY